MPASIERTLARETVTRVRERASFAHETLDAVLREHDLPRERRAFVTRLAYGTIGARGTLDDAICSYLASDVRLQSLVADCLAVSAYELLFMRTPARAAVNEGVELVKAVAPRAGSLANAVLRRLSATADEFPWGDPDTDDPALARLSGHPEWLVTRLVDEFGRATARDVLAANNEPAPLYVAHMPFRATFDEFVHALEQDGAQPVSLHIEGAVRCDSPHHAVGSTALANGWGMVVDAAAQFAASSVPLADHARFADIGAGRGTKSLLVAGRAKRAGISVDITAVDSHAFKLDALTKTAAHVGAPAISTVVSDAALPEIAGLSPGLFDAVLVDAPCTGLGTLRRHPDRRWKARPEEIEALAGLGSRLLGSAAQVVKPGGFVVYSTCTIVREENDEVIEGFLASEQGTGFVIDPIDPAAAPEEWSHFITPAGTFLSLPSPGGPDGHFIARLRRAE